MTSDYRENDYRWIEELLEYPQRLEARLAHFDDTSQVDVPGDPIERVVFQGRAKAAIRKVAQSRGHVLLVGRPGTGKSMLANMFQEVLASSVGDFLRPTDAIVAFPGKDRNHIRIAYEEPEKIERVIAQLHRDVEVHRRGADTFSLADQIAAVRRVRRVLVALAVVSALAGIVFLPALGGVALFGLGAMFMYLQESNHRAQERIQQQTASAPKASVKHLQDMIPVVLYDPRKEKDLMARVAEPDARSMKGGFRHDPYQSGNLQTPAHYRAFVGAHARSPIIYIDELKTLLRAGYMSELLEVMQNRSYVLEGGTNAGSGGADRSEDPLVADNIVVAACNHDTLGRLQEEGDGAFLSRIEDKGEIIVMEDAVPETEQALREVCQYVKQEVDKLRDEIESVWGDIIETEGYDSVRRRSERIFGRSLPETYVLKVREFSRAAVLEIVKEMRCRASDGKLTSILRPINGIIKLAEMEAMMEDARLVAPRHVRAALEEHLSLEGALAQEAAAHKRDLKKYIDSMGGSVGYVVGLAVVSARSSDQARGQPLPIRGQITPGGQDTVVAPGRTGEIARAAAQNVRASIKAVLRKIGAPYVGYEMYVDYIQAHGGVEGDSASVAMDIALVSDFIKHPVTQKFAVTGSLTGDIMLAVGGVTEKLRSIMDEDLGMEGACIPWQNKRDVEPLLINAESEFIRLDAIPGVRIYRKPGRTAPFDVYFCKTKYHACRVLMGLDREEVEARMAERCRQDYRALRSAAGDVETGRAEAAG